MARLFATRIVQRLKALRLSHHRWPLLVTTVMLATAAGSLSPVVRIVQPGGSSLAALRTPLFYSAIAPLSDVLDALTLLSPAQDWATFALCVVVFFGLKIARQRRDGVSFVSFDTARFTIRFLAITLAVLELILFAPRPMASLALSDRDLVVVDFHSHTEASHDGRAGFDAEGNRAWHRGAGFNVAYVTDHRTFDGALIAARHNPAVAGAGTTLLPGVELRDGDEHVIVIGADPLRTRLGSAALRDARISPSNPHVPPFLLLSMPGNVHRIPDDEYQPSLRLAGVEASDGSPRGLAQTARDRAPIQALAQRLRLAVVSGSDNHGWGRVAPAWSVLRVPHWREMSAEGLDATIRATMLVRGPLAVEVIARRRVPPASSVIGASLGGLAVAILITRTINWPDRISWIAWSWTLSLLAIARLRLRRRRSGARSGRDSRRQTPPPLVDAAAAMESVP